MHSRALALRVFALSSFYPLSFTLYLGERNPLARAYEMHRGIFFPLPPRSLHSAEKLALLAKRASFSLPWLQLARLVKLETQFTES